MFSYDKFESLVEEHFAVVGRWLYPGQKKNKATSETFGFSIFVGPVAWPAWYIIFRFFSKQMEP